MRPPSPMLILWSLLLTIQTARAQLLDSQVVWYMDVVSQLQEAVADPDFGTKLTTIREELGFSSFASFWESPIPQAVAAILYVDQDTTTTPSGDFSQAVVGRKDNTCFAVFKGLSPDGSWANSGLERSKYRIPADGVKRYGCSGITVEVCQCQAHTDFLTNNFPSQSEYIVERVSTCMSDCGSDCQLVLGGHGQGGAVAQLMAFNFVSQNPYVLASGSPSIMYDPDCSGFNEDRFLRFVGVHQLGSPITNTDGSSVGICFDDIPFLASDMLYDYGYTIGVMQTTDGVEFTDMDVDSAVRPICRQAHSLSAYTSELAEAYLAFPTGVPEDALRGFAIGEACTVDDDCRATAFCGTELYEQGQNGGFLHCIDTVSDVDQPTEPPVAPPTDPPTTPNQTASPTAKPTTPPPTASPPTSPQTTDDAMPLPTPAPTDPIMVVEAPTDSPPEVEGSNGADIDFIPEDDTVETPTDEEEFLPNGIEGGTPQPTIQPTQSPQARPQVPDTPAPTTLSQRTGFYQVTLVLMDVTTKLEGYSVFVWERETDSHIEEWIVGYVDLWNKMNEISDVQVSTNIVRQTLGYMGPAANNPEVTEATSRSGSNRQLRVLQQDNAVTPNAQSGQRKTNPINALELVFDVAVYYHTSLEDDLDLMVLILQAFQSERGRSEYVDLLQNSEDEAYTNLKYFSVKLSGYDDPNRLQVTEGADASDSGPDMMIWVVIGTIMGALALMLSVGYVLYLQRRQQQKEKSEKNGKGSKGTKEGTVSPSGMAMFEPAYVDGRDQHGPGNRLESEIVVRKADDDGISTLGDPFMYGGQQVMYADDPTSTSYTQNYLGNAHGISANARDRMIREDSVTKSQAQSRQSSSKGDLSLVNEASMLSNKDDDSFEEIFGSQEECFEVSAPAGKLGMVIDLSQYGEPMVRAIKQDSVLANKVKVHDLIISVDGQGCTDMSAMQVSKLLAVKSCNEARKIIFSRPTDSVR